MLIRNVCKLMCCVVHRKPLNAGGQGSTFCLSLRKELFRRRMLSRDVDLSVNTEQRNNLCPKVLTVRLGSRNFSQRYNSQFSLIPGYLLINASPFRARKTCLKNTTVTNLYKFVDLVQSSERKTGEQTNLDLTSNFVAFVLMSSHHFAF